MTNLLQQTTNNCLSCLTELVKACGDVILDYIIIYHSIYYVSCTLIYYIILEDVVLYEDHSPYIFCLINPQMCRPLPLQKFGLIDIILTNWYNL